MQPFHQSLTGYSVFNSIAPTVAKKEPFNKMFTEPGQRKWGDIFTKHLVCEFGACAAELAHKCN